MARYEAQGLTTDDLTEDGFDIQPYEIQDVCLSDENLSLRAHDLQALTTRDFDFENLGTELLSTARNLQLPSSNSIPVDSPLGIAFGLQIRATSVPNNEASLCNCSNGAVLVNRSYKSSLPRSFHGRVPPELELDQLVPLEEMMRYDPGAIVTEDTLPGLEVYDYTDMRTGFPELTFQSGRFSNPRSKSPFVSQASSPYVSDKGWTEDVRTASPSRSHCNGVSKVKAVRQKASPGVPSRHVTVWNASISHARKPTWKRSADPCLLCQIYKKRVSDPLLKAVRLGILRTLQCNGSRPCDNCQKVSRSTRRKLIQTFRNESMPESPSTICFAGDFRHLRFEPDKTGMGNLVL